MPRPMNVKKLIAKILKLDESAKAQIREALKEDPRIAKLKAERERIEAEIAALEGGTAPKKRGRKPDRKPGRPAKVQAANKPGKRGPGRPKKAISSPAKAPKGTGRRGSPTSVANIMEAPAKAPKSTRTPEQQTAINERMAKMRAARGKAK